MKTPKVGVEIKGLQGMKTRLSSGIKTASWTSFLDHWISVMWTLYAHCMDLCS